jgi:hypothetical protein
MKHNYYWSAVEPASKFLCDILLSSLDSNSRDGFLELIHDIILFLRRVNEVDQGVVDVEKGIEVKG